MIRKTTPGQSCWGTRSRRYPLFWSQYGRFSDAVRALTAQHGAVVIDGKSADELFTGLVSRVEALDRLTTAHITRDVAVVQLKRALPDPLRRIELFDVVDQAVTQIVGRSTPEHRPVLATSAIWADTVASNVRDYRAGSDTLLHLLANGAFHDDGTHDLVWRRAVERLVRLRDTTPGTYNEYSEQLRHLPALLATWTIGVAVILNRREELITTVLYHPEWALPHSSNTRQGPAWYLNPNRVLIADGMHDMHPSGNGGRFLYPQSNWQGHAARALRLVEPSDIAYREGCARFEFLASMIAMDTDNDFLAYPWAGEFFLDPTWGYDGNGLAAAIEAELTGTWPLLRAGAFGGQLPPRPEGPHHAH